MPFPWLHPNRVPSHGRRAMYHRELEERAALLCRLGYPKSRTRSRLIANVTWEFEIGGGVGPSTKEIDQLVEKVYQR